jgi:hypothetical protein
MAIAYNIVDRSPLSGRTSVEITLDGSYSSGGYALSNSGLGLLTNPASVQLTVRSGQGFTPVYDKANNKLKMFKSAAGATAHTECANTDLSSSVIVAALCTGSVTM